MFKWLISSIWLKLYPLQVLTFWNDWYKSSVNVRASRNRSCTAAGCRVSGRREVTLVILCCNCWLTCRATAIVLPSTVWKPKKSLIWEELLKTIHVIFFQSNLNPLNCILLCYIMHNLITLSMSFIFKWTLFLSFVVHDHLELKTHYQVILKMAKL